MFVGHYRRLAGRTIFPKHGPAAIVLPAAVLVYHPDIGRRESPICRCEPGRHHCSIARTAELVLLVMVEEFLRGRGELSPPPAWGRFW